jgi:hypothetical protein
MPPDIITATWSVFEATLDSLWTQGPPSAQWESLKIQRDDLGAQWLAARSAAAAAGIALFATIFVILAWRSQVRQERNTSDQLDIARADKERTRRKSGPRFTVVQYSGVTSLKCTPRLGLPPLTTNNGSIPIWEIGDKNHFRKAMAENKPFWIMIGNIRPGVTIIDWSAEISIPPSGAFQPVAMDYVVQITAGRGTDSGKDRWMLEIPKPPPMGKCSLRLNFETECGFEDTQEFEFTFEDNIGYYKFIAIRRTDPTGVIAIS